MSSSLLVHHPSLVLNTLNFDILMRWSFEKHSLIHLLFEAFRYKPKIHVLEVIIIGTILHINFSSSAVIKNGNVK